MSCARILKDFILFFLRPGSYDNCHWRGRSPCLSESRKINNVFSCFHPANTLHNESTHPVQYNLPCFLSATVMPYTFNVTASVPALRAPCTSQAVFRKLGSSHSHHMQCCTERPVPSCEHLHNLFTDHVQHYTGCPVPSLRTSCITCSQITFSIIVSCSLSMNTL